MAKDETGGVIHDIGFRHYSGPRLGRGWIMRSLLVETLRGTFGLGRSGKLKAMPWTLLGLLTVIALMMTIGAFIVKQPLPLSYTQYPIVMQFLFILFVAGRAPEAVAGDLRHGVMPLYLSRPLKREDYVFAKFLGLSLGIFIFGALPELILFVGSLLAKFPVMDQVWGFLGGLLVVALLALLLSAISLAIASFTPKRGIGVAAIVASLLIVGGTAQGFAESAQAAGQPGASAVLSALAPFGLIDRMAVALLGVEGATPINGPGVPHGAAFALALVAVFLGVIALALGFLMRRYRKVGGV